jgi:hypothetical protein
VERLLAVGFPSKFICEFICGIIHQAAVRRWCGRRRLGSFSESPEDVIEVVPKEWKEAEFQQLFVAPQGPIGLRGAGRLGCVHRDDGSPSHAASPSTSAWAQQNNRPSNHLVCTILSGLSSHRHHTSAHPQQSLCPQGATDQQGAAAHSASFSGQGGSQSSSGIACDENFTAAHIGRGALGDRSGHFDLAALHRLANSMSSISTDLQSAAGHRSAESIDA